MPGTRPPVPVAGEIDAAAQRQHPSSSRQGSTRRRPIGRRLGLDWNERSGLAARIRLHDGWSRSCRRPGPTATRRRSSGSVAGVAVQQARISVPSSTGRFGSRPHRPRPPATPRRKCRQVAHDVVERRQTQQRDDSGCGVAQWGQRQTGMARIVAAPGPLSRPFCANRRPIRDGQDLAIRGGAAAGRHQDRREPAARRRARGDRRRERRHAALVRPDLARDDRLEARDADREQGRRAGDAPAVGARDGRP